jgi:hypothetical protein
VIAEPSLDDLYREARADLAKGGADVALKWAFKHAKAVARATRAEFAHKQFDADRFRLQLDTSQPTTEMQEAVIVASQTLYAAAADLAEARSLEVACAHVARLAAATPARAAAPSVAPAAGKRAA